VSDANKAFTQSDSTGVGMDLTPWRILKLTHQGEAQDRGKVSLLLLLLPSRL